LDEEGERQSGKEKESEHQMTDRLFDQLKQVLDDGLILTPDIDQAIEVLVEGDPELLPLLRSFARCAGLSRTYYAFCLAACRSAKEAGEAAGMSAEESQIAGLGMVVELGILLGLLAAQRIKSEVSK